MRKSLIGIVLIAGIVFAAGYLIGQVRGVTASSAAGPTNNSAPTRVWNGMRSFLGAHGEGHFGPHAGGKVTAVNGDSVTVQPFTTPFGPESQVTTIQLTSTTKYATGPGKSGTKADLKVGTYIHAEGTLSSDGKTLTASTVFVSTSAPTGGPRWGHQAIGPHADGKVTAVSGDTITVQADNDLAGSTEYTKVTTIQVTSSTVYDAGPDQSGSKATIKVGTYIIAQGTLSSDGSTLTATHVMVRPNSPGAWGGHMMRHFGSDGHFAPFGGNSNTTTNA